MVRNPSNGDPAESLGVSDWVRSSISSPTGNCVELGALANGGVAVRNSRDPRGPALVYTRAEIGAFVEGARSGEFDHLAVWPG
jgi:hypothetical protein